MSGPPVAEVRQRASGFYRLLGGSSLWLLTLLCLLIAGGLIWWSLPIEGTKITIRFPEGHGLRPEDAVLYRGIEVGNVESVQLDESLNEVEVEVMLKPSAADLATEGTRFWIVRPELSLTRISGLETAIGHKYIGVSPAVSDAESPAAIYFQGLGDVPVDTLSDSGMELTLRGDRKYSVSKGASVTFRGVDVGTVLDVALSKEARYVDVRIRVFDKHAELLTQNTKFWASAGLDIDFKFGFNGGFNLDTESLETLARGGVSMITTGQGKAAQPGDVFTLHAAPKDEWFESASNFETASVALKGAVPIKGSWVGSNFFGSKRSASAQCNGVAIQKQGARSVLFPADVFAGFEEEDSFAVSIEDGQISADAVIAAKPVNGLLEFMADGNFNLQSKPFDLKSELASPAQPIDCLAVRRGDDPDAFFHLAIQANTIHQQEDNPNQWKLLDFNGDRKVWHGSPVVSAADGKLIGVLLIQPRQAMVLKLDQDGN